MIPGKKLTIEDVLQAARRRRWIIAAGLMLSVTGSMVLAELLPNRYQAETLILVVPQRIPEQYVRSTVSGGIQNRLPAISQHILSRSRLERIVGDFNLYAQERRNKPLEKVIERMRKDIDVTIVKGDSFRVSYLNSDPQMAKKVTERLASLFIEENLKDREVLADITSQFLETQLEEARRRLVEHENKLAAFRRQYTGELPDQLQANLQVYQNAQMRLQTISDTLNRDRDRRAALQNELTALNEAANAAPGGPATAVSTLPPGPAAQKLQAAVESLREMETRLTPEHPDVVRQKRAVRDLQEKADAEALARPVAPVPSLPEPRGARAVRPDRATLLRGEIDRVEQQIAANEKQEAQLKDSIATYQARVEATPKRETEMIELNRDYATLQNIYRTLLAKREESRIAADLERGQISEQFKVLDPAKVPETPYSPNIPLMAALGVVVGLILGCGLAALLEYRDTSLRSETDIASVLALPVLASIPTVRGASAEIRAARRRRLIVAMSLTSVLAGAAIVAWLRLH
jgi:polysaccharide chain length determinant protein (PEP-CTERM system associated)